MKILLAEPCGFCYGVKRAVELAENEGKKGACNIATLGPLIHNPQVIDELAQKGIACKNSLQEFKQGDTVIFRSHGEAPEVYQEAELLGLTICDAVCPYVRAAQLKAKKFAAEGYLPIIIGEKNHPEVKSISAWAGKNAIIVEYNSDVGKIPLADKYGILIQTTFEVAKFEAILAEIKKTCLGEIKIENTICHATEQRQKAAAELAKKVDAFVVIGGRNSANTRHLFELVRAKCSLAYHIETAAELHASMFIGCTTVGITAGASTPDRLIKEALFVMENTETFESMLEQSLEDAVVYPGKLVKATVIQIGKDEVYVNFGYMKEGAITYSEWAPGERDELAAGINIGDEIEAKVIPGNLKDGFVRLSRIKAVQDAAWKDVQPLAEGEKRACTVKVLRVIKKSKTKDIVGLSVAVEGVEGFMPASHVELRRVEDFTPYVGQELEAEIIEVDAEKKRLVVSRRELLRTEREAKAQAWREAKAARAVASKEAREAAEEAAYASIEEGQTVEGKVLRVAEFGLFVEIGKGLVGLVHNSELAWDRAVKATDFEPGQTVTVYVKNIDRENKRVSLSIKATQEDPWVLEADKFVEGTIVEGTVVRFLTFGAIVKISDKVEGLVHVSEIADHRVEKPEEALQIGQVVKVKVIKKDLAHRKIGLSIAKATKEEEKSEYSAYINDKPELTLDLKEQLEPLQ